MSNPTLFAFLFAAVGLTPDLALAQGSMRLAIAGPEPHFVAAWAPAAEREAEQAAVLAERVSLELRDVSLDAALKALTNAAGLRITYSKAVLPEGRRITISANDIAVITAMTEILFRSGLDVAVDQDGALALVACRHVATRVEVQDSGAIAGLITDRATNAPLAGAAISIEGIGSTGTSAADGRYRIAGVEPGAYTVRARYIGYTPVSQAVRVVAGRETVLDFGLEKSVQQLDELVTTGTLVPTEMKALPSPVSVVTGEQIERERIWRVDQLFRGSIPGTIAWDLGPNSYSAQLQVRGRNSLIGVPAIKTYIDGVEVADPVYISTIDPRSIERVEVTRGPQGSTVYGSDASGGVMQIFTKKGGARAQPEVSGSASLGAIEGPYSDGLPLRQEYSVGVAGGLDSMSYRIGGSYVRMGEWVPDYYSRTPNLSGSVGWTHGPLTAELSARYSGYTHSAVSAPQLDHIPLFAGPSFEIDEMRQQTYGLNLSYRAAPRWDHNFILGFDETRFDFYNTQPRLTTPADTFLQAFTMTASKPSFRYNTSYHLQPASTVSTTVTGGVEYYESHFANDFTSDATRTSGTIDGTHFVTRTAFSNTGFFGQVQVGVADVLFLTGGLRGERNDNFGDLTGTAWSPRVGASYAQTSGPVAFKVRASYGDAIKAVAPGKKEAFRNAFTNQIANPALKPERQEGWDTGIELYVGSRGSLAVTYYDQTAKDLIDFVFLNTDVSPVQRQNQNVGEVKNSGWELEGKLSLGDLDLGATYSRTKSTVRRLSPTYAGELRVGDHLLEVPTNTAGVTATYSPSVGTSLGVQMTHIGSWTGTDWLSLYGFFYGGDDFRGSLRDYWVSYPSVTKLAVSVTQQLTTHLTGFLHIANLGNNSRFEQNNASIPLGRVTSVGMQVKY